MPEALADATTCDDCGADVYVDDAGELYEDEDGTEIHPSDCAEEEEEDTSQLAEVLAAFVEAIDDLPDLPKHVKPQVKRLRAKAQSILDDIDI